MCQRRAESPFSKLPDDCLFFILNMMRWDWLNDSSSEMRREQKQLRRLRRQQSIQDAIMAEENSNANIEAAESDARADDDDDDDDDEGAENEEDQDFMEEDSSDDSEDADSSGDDDDSDNASESSQGEYAWGDHVGSRNAFHYNADDSSDSDDETETDLETDERTRRIALLRARRNILSFLRSY
jgi:hypothetical protein